MDALEIAHTRLHNQHLVGEPLPDPVAVVRHLGAVQAQEFAVAKWSLAQRSAGDDPAVQAVLDSGAILRTHALRPTWHFLAGEDLGWVQRLTGPRVHQFNAYYNRQHGLDEDLAARTNRAIASALRGGNHLTRVELAEVLEKAGLPSTGNRLAYVVMRAELDGLVASGVRRGKQQTYALVGERVAAPRELTDEEALAELTRRYFTSHGPATVKDFSWWSSLTMAQIRRGLALLSGSLVSEVVDGLTYWFAPGSTTKMPSPTLLALQTYDEYGVAYTESRPVGNVAGRTISLENLNTPVHPLVLDSQVIGHWRRRIEGTSIVIQPALAVKLNAAQRRALDREFARYAAFHGPGVVVKPSVPVEQ